MSKRILVVCVVVLLLCSVSIGCSRKKPPPYDAKVINPAEVDSPAQPERAGGGGRAINERQW